MSPHNARGSQTTHGDHADAGSVTEDYVGLARYLAAAIARGDVPFDKATDELAASASDTEYASLRRAADAADQTREDSLIARLLTRANGSVRAKELRRRADAMTPAQRERVAAAADAAEHRERLAALDRGGPLGFLNTRR